MLVINGKGAEKLFQNESGGHRFQRVPGTERKGRVHTSTVTVAILADDVDQQLPALDPSDVSEERYKGGKGGQHQNKHANNVRLTHRPTGLRVQVEGRHFHKNLDQAFRQLEEKFHHRLRVARQRETSRVVAAQVGSGMRGDKRRTVAIQRGQVTDHVDNWTLPVKRYLRGDW